ncbi:hypothetical protein ALC60_00790, partial [Trachymyrmex zeteki]
IPQHHGSQERFSLTRLQRYPSARPSSRVFRLYAAWLSFTISSYLPVKAEFHVSSKMRQASGCDTSRKIERVRVKRIACWEMSVCSRREEIRCNQ